MPNIPAESLRIGDVIAYESLRWPVESVRVTTTKAVVGLGNAAPMRVKCEHRFNILDRG